jgi:hypothetical protein
MAKMKEYSKVKTKSGILGWIIAFICVIIFFLYTGHVQTMYHMHVVEHSAGAEWHYHKNIHSHN